VALLVLLSFNLLQEAGKDKFLLITTTASLLLALDKLQEYPQPLLLCGWIEPIVLGSKLCPAVVVEEPLVVRDTAAGIEDGVHGDEVKGSAHSQRHQLSDPDEAAQLLVAYPGQPGEVANDQHEGAEEDQLPHRVIQKL